jgi:putative DNA methylase
MSYPIKSPRKLIEVALPLDAINEASAKEKSIRQGHPSTLHLWWARRPLATARAAIFAQLVNDPGYQQGGGFKYGMNKTDAAIERQRLFKIIEDLVLWDNISNEVVLERARVEIRRSWREVCELNKEHPLAAELFDPEKLPSLHDPFAGGGSIPLEAQRLGLEAYASDLNPVAVLINKAMIEIPPKFAGRAPVGPESEDKKLGKQLKMSQELWPKAAGLAEDVRRYGAWMREEASKRIGHLYPVVEVTEELSQHRSELQPFIGRKFPVIAWLWARTVKSPNPAFSHVDVPLVSSFVISSKSGNETYVEPVVEDDRYWFTIKTGTPPSGAKDGTKLARGANFRCILSDTAISPAYIKAEGMAGRMGARLMAVIADGPKGRIYLQPTDEMESIAKSAQPTWRPETELPNDLRNFWTINYGLTKFGDLFSQRQLVALNTFSDLIDEVYEKIYQDALASGIEDDTTKLSSGARSYSQAVCIYLSLAIGKLADRLSAIATWDASRDGMRNTFGRQAIPMVWDFAEANPLGSSTGSFYSAVEQGLKVIRDGLPAISKGTAIQADAQTQTMSRNKIISTDPPYYDNIAYADLSDFFYVWFRKTLKSLVPEIFGTLAVPKEDELVATPYRHGGKEKAEAFFLAAMTKAMHQFTEQAHPSFPITIYYAFKQSDSKANAETSSTGWETFLEAISQSGLQLSGTWPMRTEMSNRMIGSGTNALASSIILVCRKRPADAPTISRREFQRELNAVLPEALDEMTKGLGDEQSPVAPVDLSQAIIGPGMAVFSKYSAVLEADGTPMTVRTALQLINRFLAEDDFDRDTQFCLHWFEQYGWKEGPFGNADILSRAKGTSVDGVRDAGVVESGGGKVRLQKWSEYPADWNPLTDTRNPIWETLHHLIRALKQDGETGAGRLLASTKSQAESARQLAYRLYTLCERQGWAEDARAYNELITSWSAIESDVASALSVPEDKQLSVFE